MAGSSTHALSPQPSFSLKQAQPSEAGLAAKVALPALPSMMTSTSQFPQLLSWSAAAAAQSLSQTMSASLATPRGGFDPAALSFNPADLQAVASASFAAGVAAATGSASTSVAARLERSMMQQQDDVAMGMAPADLGLGPADLLGLADSIALASMLPTQGSGGFSATLAPMDLPLTQSLVLGGLQPTPSFMALAAADTAAAGAQSEGEEDDESFVQSDEGEEDDDTFSLTSSLIDLSAVALPANNGRRLVLTREQAKAAASAGKRKRRAKVAVPDAKKDDKYWRRREKNNEAARRNRMMKKAIEGVQKDRLPSLNTENVRLTDEVALLRSELKNLVGLLRQQLACEGMAVDHPIFA